MTDGEQRAALAVVRSLGSSSWRVVVTATRRGSLAGASRYADAEHIVPDPLTSSAAFVDAQAELVQRERAALLLPVTDAALLSLLPARDRLRPCTVPFPDDRVFRALADKQRVLAEAATAGIAVPEQIVVACAEDVESADVGALRYPVVLKPARSVGESGAVRARFGVTHANAPDETRARLRLLPPAAFPVLVQQRIVGPGVGVFALVWDGDVVASFAHRRLAERPPAGGVSAYAESVPVDPALYEQSRALLSRFGWQGVAMVEYKRDAQSGRAFLMEVNARFWGSLQLAIDSGVDFPRLLAARAFGENLPSLGAYRTGIRSRWSWGLVDHIIARLRRNSGIQPLPPGTPSLAFVLRALCLGWLRAGDRDAVFRWTDPRPFWRETMAWFGLR